MIEREYIIKAIEQYKYELYDEFFHFNIKLSAKIYKNRQLVC